MIGPNDLKYYVISDSSQKYDEINQVIIKFTKLYFFTMKNHSYQISQIENKINEYNVNGEVKIKQLLENQQNIIKELIKIINNFLLEKKNNEVVKKLEDQMKMDKFDKIEKKDINENNLPLKIKNIITNNNVHCFVPSHYSLVKSCYNKNNPNNIKERININNSIENAKNPSTNETIRSNLTKSTDDRINKKKVINQKKIIPLNVIAPKSGVEFNGALSFLNIKSSKQKGKKKIFRKFLNKDMSHTGNNTTKPAKKKLFKSMSTSEVTSSNKPNTINKNSLSLKINNINNNANNHYNPHYYNMNNNYTIDEEKNDDDIEKIPSIKQTINERLISISSYNANDNYGNLPPIFTKRKKRIKYRSSSGGRVLSTEKEIKRSMVRVRSAKEIPLKTDFFLHTNSSFPHYTLTNYSTYKIDFPFNRRSNSTINFFTGNNFRIRENKSLKKFENEIFSAPYINNGKRIIPTKVTKGVLNSSYKILNKYEQKRFRNNFG